MNSSNLLKQHLAGLTLEKVKAEQYRRSLKAFTKASWATIEPGVPFLNNWHIDAINEHLQAVIEGDIKRLIINIPPRHMKSLSNRCHTPSLGLDQRSIHEIYVCILRSLTVDQR